MAKSEMKLGLAALLLVGGAYMAATTTDVTNQKLALLGSGVGAGLLLTGFI